MDLDLTEEQRLLRQTVRDLCARHSTPEIVRALETDPLGYRPELWAELGRSGLLGLTVPEEFGGSGLGALDLAVVYEEFGRALCPSPHFVSGEVVVSVAWLEPGGGAGPEGVQAEATGGEISELPQNVAPFVASPSTRITGTKLLVPFASSAMQLLVTARTGDGVGIFTVDPRAPGVEITPQPTLAADASFQVRFDDAEAGARVGDWSAWERAIPDALIALAAQAVGGAVRAHEMATAYAKERVQFDRPIGSFQAIAHPLAEMAMEIEGARALTHEAAWARSTGRPATTLAAMAKLYACDVFRRTTKLGQQVFGGIGFTTDIDMQLYFRRAKQLEITWWEPRYLEALIAEAELDAEQPFVGIDA